VKKLKLKRSMQNSLKRYFWSVCTLYKRECWKTRRNSKQKMYKILNWNDLMYFIIVTY